ncbi:MAG TPA: DUF4396 domain-containing protein [Chthoniobacterales bacterium]
MNPTLQTIAIIFLLIGVASALVIAIDLFAGHPQQMWIMNLVWPINALYAGPLALWSYFTVGRLSTRRAVQEAKARGEDPPGKKKAFWQMVALGTSHCGAGCSLADLVAEWTLFFFPLILFGMKIFGAWTIDYFVALAFGIIFQFFTIAPMRGLSLGEGLLAAAKADFLSLTAWQVGMYGWMAIATFLIFGHEIEKTNPVFWFMMQIAMLVGFLTSYPVNWWLLRSGIKEKM